ncbi:unnamed protein product [Callosobruchus maculatus]|uniref:Uncharacterized protein n=1 Tax=Callosobruchus maculatus TaxID=64391 RepID=A0A653CA79_CALMS|nr:unnamed protein product [Callosobruchus maculatus]
MDEILDLCAPYTQRLFVTQLQTWKPPLTMEKEDIPEVYPIDHINLVFVLRRLPQITEFSISYGLNDVGEDFNWDMFKVSVTDCVRLGKAILELKQIKILRVHRSNIEYKHCQALMQSLIRNRTLVVLDLSNCNIGDQGALCVAKVLLTHPTLKKLNLTNNRIGQIGSEGISYALTLDKCARIHELNLRLNPLGHEGVMGVLRALVRCDIPKELIISGCNFEEETPWKLCRMIKHNTTLEGLDISNNWLGADGGEFLCESMEENKTLIWLDVRETDITPAQLQIIKKYLKRNITGVMAEDEVSQSQPSQDQEITADEEVIAETIFKADESPEEKEKKEEND